MNDDDMELNAGADRLAPARAAVCSLYDATCCGNEPTRPTEGDQQTDGTAVESKEVRNVRVPIEASMETIATNSPATHYPATGCPAAPHRLRPCSVKETPLARQGQPWVSCFSSFVHSCDSKATLDLATAPRSQTGTLSMYIARNDTVRYIRSPSNRAGEILYTHLQP